MSLCADPIDELPVRVDALNQVHDAGDFRVVRVQIVVVDVQLAVVNSGGQPPTSGAD
jgi:hypothetical protein